MTQKDSHSEGISFPLRLFSISELPIKLGLIEISQQSSVLRRLLQNDTKR
jgi:hypothetical protein